MNFVCADKDRSINGSGILDLSSVHIEYDSGISSPFSVLCDSIVKANIEIISHFPGPVQCHEVYITMKKTMVDEKPALSKSQEKANPVVGTRACIQLEKATTSNLHLLPIKEQHHLKQDGSLSSVALVYPNLNQLING